MALQELTKELKKLENKEKAKLLQGFFKTGPGQYGEGDIFLGITVPQQRKIAKKFLNEITLDEAESLLNSKIHEERLVSLLILVEKYKKSSSEQKEEIYNFYIKNAKKVNNWDLVDLSSHRIIGNFLFDKDRSILYRLAKSANLWERRISIISTFYFIQNNQFEDSIKLAEILLHDSHDLIQKAVGWMLREVGKKDLPTLESFLKKHYKTMPRTMLRYAIEKFPENKRKEYLHGQIK
jgi:3-methyladenine DNA glycosylase AlkD